MRILRNMRLLAPGDRNPDFLTHREIDSKCSFCPLTSTAAGAGELHPILSAWLRAAALH